MSVTYEIVKQKANEPKPLSFKELVKDRVYLMSKPASSSESIDGTVPVVKDFKDNIIMLKDFLGEGPTVFTGSEKDRDTRKFYELPPNSEFVLRIKG